MRFCHCSADIQLAVVGTLLLLALVGVIVASAAYATPWGLFVCTQLAGGGTCV